MNDSNESFQDRVDRERKERLARYSELFHGVAKYLDGWTVKETEDEYNLGDRFYLVSEAEAGQKIDLGFTRGKVHVSGYWPQRGKHGAYISPCDVSEESPSINVSLARGHAAIARDITRRFIPEYQRIWEKLKAKISKEIVYADNKAASWRKLVASGGIVNPRERDGEQSGDIRMPGGYDNGYGDIRMSGENSVEIHLRSLPVDTAIAVLNALKGVV